MKEWERQVRKASSHNNLGGRLPYNDLLMRFPTSKAVSVLQQIMLQGGAKTEGSSKATMEVPGICR